MKKAISVLLSLGLVSVIGTTTLVLANATYKPEANKPGNSAATITPDKKGDGENAEVLLPNEQEAQGSEELKPFEPFVPEIIDPDPFVDIEETGDYSTEYDYTNASVSARYGNCTIDNGTYTATTSASIYANFDEQTPFPYGTLNATVKSNGGDTGVIFGLTSNQFSFWEGSGISYYFAFVNKDGVAYLGKTDNGKWSELGTATIPSFSTQATYNLSVLFRGNRIIMSIDNVIYVNTRDFAPLTGTAWGLRTGIVGATVSNLTASSKVTIG